MILGIDPGSALMGYALLSLNGQKASTGLLKLSKKATLAEKTASIFSLVDMLIEEHGVKEMAIEEFYYHKDPRALARVSHCRGAAMAAAALKEIPVFEYPPMEVKKAVAGYGHATKEQIAWVLRKTVEIEGTNKPDETDALAVALCHLNRQRVEFLVGNRR